MREILSVDCCFQMAIILALPPIGVHNVTTSGYNTTCCSDMLFAPALTAVHAFTKMWIFHKPFIFMISGFKPSRRKLIVIWAIHLEVHVNFHVRCLSIWTCDITGDWTSRLLVINVFQTACLMIRAVSKPSHSRSHSSNNPLPTLIQPWLISTQAIIFANFLRCYAQHSSSNDPTLK